MIDETIQKIVEDNELNVSRIDQRSQYPGRYQVALANDSQDRQLLIKKLISPRVQDERGFINELNVFKNRGKDLDDYLPGLIDFELNEKPYWYLRMIGTGEVAGVFNAQMSFSSAFIDLVQPEKMVELFSATTRYGRDSEVRREAPIVRDHFLVDYINSALVRHSDLIQPNMASVITKLLEEKRLHLIDSVFVYNHNDLYPDNIFYNQSDLAVVDWERSGFDYPLKDPALVSLMLWPYPEYAENYRRMVWHQFDEFAMTWFNQRLGEVLPLYWDVMRIYWSVYFLDFFRTYLHFGKRGLDFIEGSDSFTKHLVDTINLISSNYR